MSILLIEQDAVSALAIADYGYIMEGGRIVYEGSAEKLRSHQDVQEFYLGSGDSSRVQLSRREAVSPQPTVVGMTLILDGREAVAAVRRHRRAR